MITTGFDSRVKVQQIIKNQLPEFLLSESPKTVEFLKQYYISQEYQGGPIDIVENLDQYLNFNNLTPEVISGKTTLIGNITDTSETVFVSSTKGFPKSYGLFKIDDEIITYTGITTNSFTGCIRSFSGIVSYKHQNNPEELVFSKSSAKPHSSRSIVNNLSVEFLKEFYKKLKYLFAPGFEDINFVSDLNVNNFIKQIRNFYEGKGTDDSFRILFNILYGVDLKVINLENFLFKPSNAIFIRREILITERISGNPNNLVGQTVRNKSNTASGPVSEVEIVARKSKTFYKIQLFAGYSEKSLIEGTFEITPKTKVSDFIPSGSSSITVDSTIGFPKSGVLICGENNNIRYADKSVNQFFGCTNILYDINVASDIRSDNIIYGYENGDTSKLVELRITGVLSNILNKDKFSLLSDNEIIKVRNIGEKIFNNNETYKEFFFNTWIYNVRTRYDINNFTNNEITLYEIPDKSSLKRFDIVDILDINSENIVLSDAKIISISSKIITLNKNITNVNSNRRLTVRRKYNYFSVDSSSNISLSSNKILSNIQNTYNEFNEYAYIASNSLPDYQVSKSIYSSIISITESTDFNLVYRGYDKFTDLYSILIFDNDVPFVTGDAVVYTGTGTEIEGLTFGTVYYIELIKEGTRKNAIRLYNSRSFINTNSYIEFSKNQTISTHTFTLKEHYNKKIFPKKSLHKIPLNVNNQSGNNKKTKSGPIGALINGVEIINYKSDDRIYYGPIESVKVYNGGFDYDVVNPPTIEVSKVGIGTTALVQAVVNGSIKEVVVDPQQFNISKILSAYIIGGNGFGAKIQPILSKKYRELEFNGVQLTFGLPNGGVDITNETITFKKEHNLVDGEKIVYDKNGNQPLGIGSFGGSNTDQEKYLINGSIYYPKVINPRTIILYNSENGYISGINTIGFTTSNLGGLHKFRLYEESNTISEIKVLDSGYDYENRKLRVLPIGISTFSSIITYENHGFRDGAIVRYSYKKNIISGLSTSNQYHIIKISDSEFQLSDGGPISSSPSLDNFNKKNFVKIKSSGEGYQIFEYPKIEVIINAEIVGSGNTIVSTPIVRGKIIDTYLYENGTDYGSKILNFHKKPFLFIKNGQESQLKPIIFDGKIINVEVQNGGKFYNSPPDLIITGDGQGAKLRSIVQNGKIVDVVVINSGANYTSTKTKIRAQSSGKNCVLDSSVRFLTINNYSRFSDEILYNYQDNFSYGIVGYSTDREGKSFLDPDGTGLHSKVIGWCYDGNPIYGPFAFENPKDLNSKIVTLKSGYSASLANIINRPIDDSFPLGFFVEDYKFESNGALDVHNGRFSKTPEFPNGIYAYYVGISTDDSTSKLVPQFPYFIGDTYRSTFNESSFDQDFDFNKSNLIRNTFPYRVNQEYSNNDFIVESSKESLQLSIVESVSRGDIDSLTIANPGDNYRIGNSIIFNNSESEGSGASAEVSKIKGKEILNVQTSYEKFENSIVTRESSNLVRIYTNNYHQFKDQDFVRISGITTYISGLEKYHVIGVSSENTFLIDTILSNTGIVTDIYVSSISPLLKPNFNIGIGTETLRVLNIFSSENILRVERGDISKSHSQSSKVNYYNHSFTIPLETKHFDSSVNFKIFFNPKESVGLGTTSGAENISNFFVGKSKKSISIPTRSIYIPNHGFKTNQMVLLTKPSSSSSLLVSNVSGGNEFNIPQNGDSQYVYVINKSKDFIGIVTQVGLTTTQGLFFNGYGSNNYEYSIESTSKQITTTVDKIKSKITTTDAHGLLNDDSIKLNLKSNLSIGIGAGELNLKYSNDINQLLINPIGFSSSSVNIENDKIYVQNHGYLTGDKIFYNSYDGIISGLTTGIYYVVRMDDNYFRLAETYFDSTFSEPNYVSIASSGGTNQEISLTNPKILVTRNNNLIFNVSHSSLVGYQLKFYYDSKFLNEFISTGESSDFSVERIGIPGETSSAKCRLIYDDLLPNKLYYSLEKNGKSIIEVLDYNVPEISYTDSLYNGEYKVFGVGTTDFYINLNSVPEKLSYQSSELKSVSYTTNSKNVSGPISEIKLISKGSNYKKLPKVSGLSSSSANSVGSNAIIKPNSTTIGNLNQFRIVNEGFDYSCDKTLSPETDTLKYIRLKNSQKITKIEVLDSGKNYVSEPFLVIVNKYTNERVDSGIIKGVYKGNGVISVEVIHEPKGLGDVNHQIYCINNSNGISIEQIQSYSNMIVQSYSQGIVRCVLSTPPLNGFIIPPFKIGDLVFVEGIRKQSFTDNLGNTTSPGNGFNSADNGFNFFKVVNYINSNPAILEFDIGEYTKNAGIPVVNHSNFYTNISKIQNYPIFKITQVPGIFYLNENLIVNGILTDLNVEIVDENFIKVTGDYVLKENDKIKGFNSGIEAEVEEFIFYENRFSINYSNKKLFGWENESGKVSSDLQVLPNNDYYQNLSYSIKSPIEFEKWTDNVNKFVHTSGMKNFADMQLDNIASVSIGVTQSLLPTLDFISEKRVDVIKDVDFVLDYEASADSSRKILFKSKRLSDYVECKTNRVLQIDDISNRFSSSEFNKLTFTEVIDYPITDFYSRFLVQVADENKLSSQLSEVVILNNYSNTYTLNKVDLFTNERLGVFYGDKAETGDMILRFDPDDANTKNYNIKVYRQSFSQSPFNIGVGFTNIGFSRLNAKTETVGPNSGFGQLGISTSVFRSLINDYNTVYAYAHITDTVTNGQNYFEIVGYHDGNNSYISEYYFDTQNSISALNSGFIGTFGLNLNNGILDLVFKNQNSPNNIQIKVKTVGIGSTSIGIGTYRYLVDGQLPETERSAKLESSYTISSGITTTIAKYSTVIGSSSKSIIRVSTGSTVSVHNLYVVSDQQRVNIQQTPFLSLGTLGGIGTFSSSLVGTDVSIKFHPDPQFSNSKIVIQSYTEFIYFDVDEFNIPSNKTYGTSIEGISNAFYGSINEFGKDKLDFDLNYNRIPIFQKFFNPSDTNKLDLSTGIFTINDHFFENGEELIYTPDSTLIGVNPYAIGIGTTEVGGSLITADIISGFSTITGIANTSGLKIGYALRGSFIPNSSTITGIAKTYSYFVGNVVSGGSSIITGIANTSILKVGSGIYSGNNTSLGTIYSIGINSITASQSIPDGSERLYYSSDLNWSAKFSNVSTGTKFRSVFATGITTNICPSEVYAIRLSKDSFKITGTLGNTSIGFTFTSIGSGNLHKLEMKKKLEKTLITIDGVTQYPLMSVPLLYSLSGNDSVIGVGVTFLSTSGISSLRPRDILNIENEFLVINNVGIGTSSLGPITGIGTIPIVEVKRGALGSAAKILQNGSEVKVFRGSYNIVGNKIHFSEAPDGRGSNDRLNSSNLRLPKSSFNGRVYLRKNYNFNKIYDDISDSFTGLGKTYTVYKDGKNTTGLEAGSNILYINDVFQTPDTENNTGNNYAFAEDSITGISSVIFTGINRPNTTQNIIVDYDINQNQLPRGGVVIGVAVTGGLGYAPLIGANFRAELSGGSINKVVGFPTYGNSYFISTAKYNNLTGIIEVTTVENHPFDGSEDNVYLEGLKFSCSSGAATTTIFPTGNLGFVFPVVGIVSAKTFKANVGLSTIQHDYVTGGKAYPYYSTLSFGSGYRSAVSIGITDPTGTGAIISVSVGAGGTLIPNIVSGGNNYTNPSFKVDSPSYSDLRVIGISRPGVGLTTRVGIGVSMTFSVASSLSVGAGSTYFRIFSYDFTKRGYGFQLGDVFEPVGLVTDARISEPIEKIRFTVTDLFNDSFASWQLGEFDYIDSTKELQDGIRTRFPLFKNSQLLSFQKNLNSIESQLIDFDSVLLIYVNGVMQEPGVSYEFTGGTTFLFKEAPRYEDKVDIFFYRGTRNIDSVEVNINESIKVGDSIQIKRNESILNTFGQEERVVKEIDSADTIETGIYLLDGIDSINYKPADWIKQKRDLLIQDNPEYKVRDSIEGMVFPTSKIIKNFIQSDTEVFLDNAQFFNYEENESSIEIPKVSALLIPLESDIRSPKLIANVSYAGTISSISILDSGSGYKPNTTIKLNISNPIGGIGTSIFKTSVRDRVGTVGIRSDVIVGIRTSGIRIGNYMKSITGVVDNTFVVVGISTENEGSVYLNKDSYNNSLQIKSFTFGKYQTQSKCVATANVSSLEIVTSVSISSPGSGYTSTSLPSIIPDIPKNKVELVENIQFVQGFTGIITGISTNVGTNGNSLSLKFFVSYDSNSQISDLKQGYPIYISETAVGNGVTSIDNNDSDVVGIGSTFLDNIYYIHNITNNNLNGVITANILSTTNTIGIKTSSYFCGRFSWGRLSGFERKDGAIQVSVKGLKVNPGLTSFPILQRRAYGLRDNGSLRKELG